MPVVRTDGRAYGHVITKFSRMGRLPHFLTHGVLLRASRARAPLLVIGQCKRTVRVVLKYLDRTRTYSEIRCIAQRVLQT